MPEFTPDKGQRSQIVNYRNVLRLLHCKLETRKNMGNFFLTISWFNYDGRQLIFSTCSTLSVHKRSAIPVTESSIVFVLL